ncbi:diguanylate cyclase [Sulfurimonas sp. SAG-AH-194-C21]|nr:diguanylate cyclase [Sulfurimonas sp. SAG-AH-194-C21]MDF1883442.1 diguanylate cyclase [Sulfurimonas sp. SAG-AH-194-C21]
MFNTKKSKFIALSIVFIVILFLGNYAIHQLESSKKTYYLNTQNELLTLKYDTVYKYYKIMSKDIYSMYSQNTKLITLLSQTLNATKEQQDIYRKEIYRLLIRNYRRLANMGISQVHFHTPDNKSFLRMYAPDTFGDDLTKLRHSVVKANATLKPQEGFEACAFMAGLRFVYPLFNKNKEHIGSVEISFSTKELLESVTDDFLYDSHILVNKEISNSTIIKKQYLTNYKPTWESENYFLESFSHKNQNDKNIYKQISTPTLQAQIEKNINTKKVFSLDTIYNYQNIILTFFPIPSNDGIKNIAYIVKYVASDYMSNLKIEHDYIILLFFTITSILYLFGIYVIINREKLKEMALYDSLTRLPNRRLFEIEFENEIQRAQRHEEVLALMFIDLDGFKAVNDTYGHEVGDKLLIKVSEILLSCIRKSDFVSRLGGDEFTVILTDIKNSQEALQIANTIVKEINRELVIDKELIHIGASIGISLYPQDAKNMKTLIKYADSMMYAAKTNGKNQVYQFQKEK